MILELVEYLLTPSSRLAKSMGFLTGSIDVRARHRRCRQAWSPHLRQTRRMILHIASLCTMKRKVMVLGGGMLHDIPLKELSGLFRRVLLVDMVHPLSSRLAVRRFGNVEQTSSDVTEAMVELQKAASMPGKTLPVSHPVGFVDDPELDLTLSVNLLSQLALVPGRYLQGRRDERIIDAFSKHLVEAHLDYLCRLPGRTALITDVCLRRITAGETIETWDPLFGVVLPEADRTWEWHLAPSPEIARGVDVFSTVSAFADWKKASGRSPGAIA